MALNTCPISNVDYPNKDEISKIGKKFPLLSLGSFKTAFLYPITGGRHVIRKNIVKSDITKGFESQCKPRMELK